MLETLRAKYFRTSQNGRIDLGAIFRNAVIEPTSNNEIPKDTYLEGLVEVDRIHVEGFLDFAKRLHGSLEGLGMAVIAVGSSVRSEEQRHHPTQDIDLRVLNAMDSVDLRTVAVASIRDGIRGYLQAGGLEFEESDDTTEVRMVKGESYDPVTKVSVPSLLPFMDWYNNDPSFVVKFAEGLPLHLSISGHDNPDMEYYLSKERANNSTFSLLYKGEPPI